MILAAFSSCCCYEFWLPFPPAAAEAFAAAAGPRMGKYHGYVFLLLQKLLLLLLLVPGWENTMAVQDGEAPKLKDGEAPKLHPENG